MRMMTTIMKIVQHLFSARVPSWSGETEAWVNAVNWSSIAHWHRVPGHDHDDVHDDDDEDDAHDDEEEFLS